MRAFNDLKLTTKLALPAGLVLLVALGLVGLARSGLAAMDRTMGEIVETRTNRAVAALRVANAVAEATIAQRSVIIEDSHEARLALARQHRAAEELAERGYDVTIVDRRREPAAETSFANGAQLSYAFVAPLASPETLAMLPGLLLSSGAPIRIRPTYDPAFIRWGLRFLAACNTRSVEATTRAQLALAALSRTVLADLAQREALAFGLRTAGKLVVYRKAESFEAAKVQAQRQAQAAGSEQEVLSAIACLALEPSLMIKPDTLAGGIHTPSEQVGDCRRLGLPRFCGRFRGLG
ncbi:FAD-dependent oxidoreductase [Methylobacterium sp. NEAU 140]|uniref:FAD-dependent oxidoreductase n=1 Tax=Methylobacterium sp. NEAU 140 TaxID=3064945 RepID=UPI00273442D9|nr:FAD-dependent oxidoreductase [Methylobacterium sp. NEAU 140]MDP4027333.1 FAD-dependent oxidoreductase [Methylobacterium sp. NEAU 140]